MSPALVNLLTIAGVAIGGLSILVTVVLAVRSAEKKKPICSSVTIQKIAASEKPPHNIQISYKGIPVERVSTSFIWFWNAGRRPILKEDVPGTQPLQIKIPADGTNATILDFALRRVSRTCTNIAVTKEDDFTLSLTFDFLDFHDGCVIEIQHTGGGWSDPSMGGVILGVPKGVEQTKMLQGRRASALRSGYIPELPMAYRRSPPARTTQLRRTLYLTLLAVAILLGGPVAAKKIGKSSQKITITNDNLHAALYSFLKGNKLDSALVEINRNAREDKKEDPAIPIRVAAIFIWLIGLGVIWSRPYDFPDSLLLTEVSGDSSTAGLHQNQ